MQKYVKFIGIENNKVIFTQVKPLNYKTIKDLMNKISIEKEQFERIFHGTEVHSYLSDEDEYHKAIEGENVYEQNLKHLVS